jgi:hypothetical protein
MTKTFNSIRSTALKEATEPTDSQLHKTEETEIEEGASGYKPGWMLKADPKLKSKVDAVKAKHKEFTKLVGTKVDREPKGEYDRKVDSYLKKKYNKEEVELEEDMKSAAKEMHGYASKHGGMDKDDFHKAAKHMEAGNHKALQSLIKKLDSDPRDKILTTLHKHGNDIKRYGYSTEDVEQVDESINELKKSTLGSYVKKASGNMGMHAVDHGKYGDQQKASLGKAKKRLSGIEKATDRLTKEEVQSVEEAMDNKKPPFDGPYKKTTGQPRKDRFGNVIKPHNIAKHLAKKAMKQYTKEEIDLMIDQLLATEVESLDENYEETSMMLNQIEAMEHFIDGIYEYVEECEDCPEWYQNKLTMAFSQLQSLYSFAAGEMDKEEDEDEDETEEQYESTAAYGKSLEKEKEKRLTPADQDKLAKIRAMLGKEKKNK